LTSFGKAAAVIFSIGPVAKKCSGQCTEHQDRWAAAKTAAYLRAVAVIPPALEREDLLSLDDVIGGRQPGRAPQARRGFSWAQACAGVRDGSENLERRAGDGREVSQLGMHYGVDARRIVSVEARKLKAAGVTAYKP